MSFKKILDNSNNNIEQEYGKIGIAACVVFGWMLMGSFVYTVISLARKIRK